MCCHGVTIMVTVVVVMKGPNYYNSENISGLATRHSLVYKHEESPAWVGRAWLNLQHFSHGVCLALTLHLSQVSQ